MQGNHSNTLIPESQATSVLPVQQIETSEKLKQPRQNFFVRPREDSQISTSSDSSNTSSRNSSLGHLSHRHDSKENAEATKFPVLVQAKLMKPKTKPSSQNLKENEIDSPVTEEKEEQEAENQFLKKLPVIADGEEFIINRNHINRFRGREIIFNKDMNRCRSLETSFLPLDSVQEDKNEEESNTFKNRRALRQRSFKMEDLNEFNKSHNERSSFERKDRRNMSMQMQAAKEVIMEEQENKVPHLQSIFANYSSANGSRRGSLLNNSPGQKLKVDEIDMWGKQETKEDDSDENEIDPIMEENEEKNGQAGENKEFQVAKAKLHEEREFLKKVVKGDIMDENNSTLIKIGSEREYVYLGANLTEEIIEEDNNENFGN